MEDNMFPKFQISMFHDATRKIQSVFRTNDKQEYKDQLKEWTSPEPRQPYKETPVVTVDQGVERLDVKII